jgi:pantoate--beta-alanine ligase
MRVISSVTVMQRLAARWRRHGVRVGFVPTMGCLHAGHLRLVRRARQSVGPKGQVVLSIYVNPTQFGPQEDLASYPRDFSRDAKLCRQAGVDVIFAPSDREMYPTEPASPFSTYVVEQALSQGMEGASRPTHFRGVTTVVAKLFNIVLPDVAVFGAKDCQQAAVVRRMTRDLNFPVRILVAPTVREPDGLALSSRNQYLSPDERAQATALWHAIQHAARAVETGVLSAGRLRAALKRRIEQQPAARVDYIEFFDPTTLRPARQVRRGTHLALAVWVGKTRLIDNARL